MCLLVAQSWNNRVDLHSLVERSIKHLEIHLGSVGAGGDEPDDGEGEAVDASLKDAEDGGDRAGEGSFGEDAVLADDDLEEVLVDFDEVGESGADAGLVGFGEFGHGGAGGASAA